MDRINDPTAEADKFGAGKDGFTEGDPGLVDRTIVRAAWLDGVQEEIVRVIEGAGLTPSSADLGQLLKSVRKSLRFAVCAISGTSVAASTNFTMTLLAQSGGFSVASNQLTPPADGYYLVLFFGRVLTADTSNPANVTLTVDNGSGDDMIYVDYRPTASASDPVTVSMATISLLLASEVVRVLHVSGSNQDIQAGSGRLVVLGVSTS